MKALILIGGDRALAAYESSGSTARLLIGGEPALRRTLRQLKSVGVGRAIVVGDRPARFGLAELVSDAFARDFGVSVDYVVQRGAKGIGRAVLSAKSYFDANEDFLLVYGDVFTGGNIFSSLLAAHSIQRRATAAIRHARAKERYGNVYLGADATITKIIGSSKRDRTRKSHNYALAGAFAMSSSIFDYLKAGGSNMERALNTMSERERIGAAIWEDEWVDLSHPWDILEANQYALSEWDSSIIDKSSPLKNVEIEGNVRIGANARISSGVVLKGPIAIGAGSFIGHSCLIRPYTAIGENVVIGQGAELKNSVIFDNSEIGRLSFIGDSVIGSDVEIGAGCMTINNRIGRGALTARIGKREIDSGLKKLGAFIQAGATIGASNIFAAGSVIQAGASIDHNVSIDHDHA